MHQASTRYKSLTIAQLLHDLDWLVRSKVMLDRSSPDVELELCYVLIDKEEEDAYHSWYTKLKEDPSLLREYFDSTDQLILGKYFERLLTFFFSRYPRYEIIESGKQLFIDGETIGELDFILIDKLEEQTVHLEVAVKYYLCYKNSSKHDMWIGPNGSDTLAKKERKIAKQLKHSLLYNKLIDDIQIDNRLALLKGYLFQHIHSFRWPFFYNEAIEKGIWMYFDEMAEYLNEEYFYLILPKSTWLSFYIDPAKRLKSKSEIIIECALQLELIKKGIMIVSIEKENRKIIDKMMVLPKHWPSL